jgi:AcrR family transcriptional regulator
VDSADPQPRRRPRADALRNLARLLAAAEAEFRRAGTQASLERIARSAGVAIGTLYSHFPTRYALVAAVLRERNDALFALGERQLAEPSADRALTTWVRAVCEHAAAYRGLAEVLAAGFGDESSELHGDCARLSELTCRIAARARALGSLRADVLDEDLTALMTAAAWTREQLSARQADRLIDHTLAGLCAHRRVSPQPSASR